MSAFAHSIGVNYIYLQVWAGNKGEHEDKDPRLKSSKRVIIMHERGLCLYLLSQVWVNAKINM